MKICSLFHKPITTTTTTTVYDNSGSIKIIIGEKPDFKIEEKTKLITDFFYDPPEPDDWIHTLQSGRLIPEWNWENTKDLFALVNGERIKNQLCLSNESTYNVVLTNLRNKILAHPEIKYWSVSIGDNNNWCQCPKCNAERPSDTLIRFVNKIAIEFPNKIISTLAYYSTEEQSTINVENNVQVMITTIQIPKDIPFELSDRADVIEWVNRLKSWLKIVNNPSQILVWDYYSNFRHLLMPFPILYNIGPNFNFFARFGIKNFITQTNAGLGHEFTELKSQLIAELMNNPFIDDKKIINDFLLDYYGKSSPYVKQYIDLLYNEQKKGYHLINWCDPSEFQNSFLSNDVIIKSLDLLSLAHDSVINTSYEIKIDEVKLQMQYSKIELNESDDINKNDFFATCSQLGPVTVNENNLLWSDYLKTK